MTSNTRVITSSHDGENYANRTLKKNDRGKTNFTTI